MSLGGVVSREAYSNKKSPLSNLLKICFPSGSFDDGEGLTDISSGAEDSDKEHIMDKEALMEASESFKNLLRDIAQSPSPPSSPVLEMTSEGQSVPTHADLLFEGKNITEDDIEDEITLSELIKQRIKRDLSEVPQRITPTGNSFTSATSAEDKLQASHNEDSVEKSREAVSVDAKMLEGSNLSNIAGNATSLRDAGSENNDRVCRDSGVNTNTFSTTDCNNLNATSIIMEVFPQFNLESPLTIPSVAVEPISVKGLKEESSASKESNCKGNDESAVARMSLYHSIANDVSTDEDHLGLLHLVIKKRKEHKQRKKIKERSNKVSNESHEAHEQVAKEVNEKVANKKNRKSENKLKVEMPDSNTKSRMFRSRTPFTDEEEKAKKAHKETLPEKEPVSCGICAFPSNGLPVATCENCKNWYHIACAGLDEAVPTDYGTSWFCHNCNKRKRKACPYS
ncbi:uncharacterized protein LOC135120542 [Zophobas morio]|uniref:uncharacterized protein LOC135120542 n=1 Tax=Zophobas morio TaxID=2755281 RepID=UPI003082AA50